MTGADPRYHTVSVDGQNNLRLPHLSTRSAISYSADLLT
jgi:hypothetical protein